MHDWRGDVFVNNLNIVIKCIWLLTKRWIAFHTFPSHRSARQPDIAQETLSCTECWPTMLHAYTLISNWSPRVLHYDNIQVEVTLCLLCNQIAKRCNTSVAVRRTVEVCRVFIEPTPLPKSCGYGVVPRPTPNACCLFSQFNGTLCFLYSGLCRSFSSLLLSSRLSALVCTDEAS